MEKKSLLASITAAALAVGLSGEGSAALMPVRESAYQPTIVQRGSEDVPTVFVSEPNSSSAQAVFSQLVELAEGEPRLQLAAVFNQFAVREDGQLGDNRHDNDY